LLFQKIPLELIQLLNFSNLWNIFENIFTFFR
jgi:hypothetical protein